MRAFPQSLYISPNTMADRDDMIHPPKPSVAFALCAVVALLRNSQRRQADIFASFTHCLACFTHWHLTQLRRRMFNPMPRQAMPERVFMIELLTVPYIHSNKPLQKGTYAQRPMHHHHHHVTQSRGRMPSGPCSPLLRSSQNMHQLGTSFAHIDTYLQLCQLGSSLCCPRLSK
jgi:hypothetical protein